MAPSSFLATPSSPDIFSSSEMTLRYARGPRVTGRDGKLLVPKEPKRGTVGSAGIDLFVAETETLRPGDTCILDTHFTFHFPREVYGQLHLRSSACNGGLLLLGGVIGERDL